MINNRTSTIAENCRAILRERCYNQQSKRYSSNGWKPCPSIPTNPIYSLYGVNNFQMPTDSREKPLLDLSTNVPRHPNCIERNTTSIQSSQISSENCIQMITNSIINKVRYKVPQQELALLCCCLPSLIRQIMSRCPWLTPNAIVQCLTADIIKEAMNCLNEINLNINNEIPKSKKEDIIQSQKDETRLEDHVSITSPEDDNDSLSSYQSTNTQQSSKSILNLPNNNILPKKSSKTKKKKHRKKPRSKSRTPSTRSFATQQSKDSRTPSIQSLASQRTKDRTPSTRSIAKQQSKDREPSTRSIARKPSKDRRIDSHHSLTPSTKSMKSKSKQPELNSSIHIEDDEISIASPYQDSYLSINTFDSDEEFDAKTIDITPKLESVNQFPRIEYPGKKDPNAHADLQKCLEFYQKIRQYFDDDVSAMLFKCCLCYGDCSRGQKG